jgi:hypothetical protein
MGIVTVQSKTAGAVVDEPVVVPGGPGDEQAATAAAIAEALDPVLVARLAAQARAQRCSCWVGAASCSS